MSRFVLLYILLLCAYCSAPADSYALSVAKQVQNPAPQAVRADDMLSKAKQLQVVQPDSALQFAKQALSIFTANGDDRGIALVRQVLGSIETKLGNISSAEQHLQAAGKYFENNDDQSGLKDNYILYGLYYERVGQQYQAIESYNKAIVLAKNSQDFKSLGICYNNIGVNYEMLGDYPRALNNYFQALNFKNQLSDESGKASVYNNIGNIFKLKGELDAALDYHQKSLAIRKQQNDDAGVAMSLNNIGTIHKNKGNIETAMKTFADANAIAVNLWDKRLLARVYTNMAGVFLVKRDYKSALNYYQKAIKIFEEQADSVSLASCYHIYGALLFEIRNPQSAVTFLKKSLSVANSIGARTVLKEALSSLAICYASTGQFDSAFVYQTKFSAVLDSITTSSVVDNISKVQLRYESEQRGKEIQSLLKTQEESNLALIRTQEDFDKLRIAHSESSKENMSLLLKTKDDNMMLSAMTAEAEKNRLEAEHKQQQILLLTKDKQLSEAELRRQRLLAVFGGTASVFLAVLTVLLFRANSNRKRHNQILSESNAKVEEKAAQLEQRNVEIMLQKGKLADLASEITLKNVELSEVNEVLHQTNAEREQLLAIATHDLKNSISGIKMLSGILASTPERLNAEEIKEFGVSIKDSSEHLFHVINNFSDINRIEQGTYPIHLDSVAVADIITTVVSKNMGHAYEKNITIDYSEAQQSEIAVTTDANAVNLVLSNLVSNAITFSPVGSTISLGVETSQDSSVAKLIVKDSGPGFTEDDIAKLYTTFAKLSARPTGGEFASGLGLVISKKLADISGGTLELASTSEKGSVFTLEYPIAAEAAYPHEFETI